MVVGALIVARRPGNAKERVIANPSGTVGCPILSRAPS
jgi:hypothetical protein